MTATRLREDRDTGEATRDDVVYLTPHVLFYLHPIPASKAALGPGLKSMHLWLRVRTLW